jgi:acyl-CoA synthetase (AMP-forming)/AMP-acid ligase II
MGGQATVGAVAGSTRTTVALMKDVVARHPDHEAFIDRDLRLTYGAWDRAADGLAAHLADLGVGHGDIVALLLPSSVDYAIAYQAIMRLGAITTGINSRLGNNEVASILERTTPVVFIVADDLDAPAMTGTLIKRSELAALYQHDPLPSLPSLRSDDPVAIVWTSGTTGRPKGAVFDHDRLRVMSEGAGILSERFDRRMSPLPFPHVGYMTRVWDEVSRVMTTVIVPSPWTAPEALRLIEDERITVAQGVPTQWTLMLRQPAFDDIDKSSLRLAGSGGTRVPPELVREMRERLPCPVIVRYSSTEGSLLTGTEPGDPDDVIANTVGRAAPNVEVIVADDDGNPLPVGEVGVVRARSGATLVRYWDDPSPIGEDGFLSTGDLGRFDEHGNLTLVGRRTEMYIRGGYNVYPGEVEDVLGEHPAIDRVAIVGVPDPVLGEIGVAFVVAGAPVTLDEMRVHVAARLADYKRPDRLVVADELPLTAMLKVDKASLRTQWEKDNAQ